MKTAMWCNKPAKILFRLLRSPKFYIVSSLNITRKSSCLNVRGRLPRSKCSLALLFCPGGGGGKVGGGALVPHPDLAGDTQS